jgi:putative ABC transport system substrate-binding protein
VNKRRKLLVALGAGALTAPFGSFAQQQGKVWRVGFLAPRRPDDLATDVYSGFPRGMRDLGYIERKNLIIEWRYADGVLDRLPGLAAELVRLKVDVIVTAGTPATSAAQKATATIPIVMGSAADPVASGFVKSLARPGGNITGLSTVVTDVSPKRLELLLNVVPKVSRVAVLVDPNDSSHAAIFKSLQVAAKKAGITVLAMDAKTPQEIETAFFLMAREKAGGLIVVGGGVFNQQEGQIAELAVKKRLPSISSRVEYAKVGGLMSYGDNRAETFRHVATFVDKILKGAKPSDLPVEQPTIFELLVNGKTAKALGLKIPQSILVRADKVIE